MNIQAAKQFVTEYHSYLLVAHQSPDGDTLGSCLALQQALEAKGKTVTVACADGVPERLRFLTGAERVITDVASKDYEAVVFVDCADHKRVGALMEACERIPHQFCIDHHMTNPKTSKDGDWVENRAACGEMILALTEELCVPMTKSLAECLFTAIATDSGNFAYSNTTPETFRSAARLLECGIDLPELNRKLFRTVPIRKSRLIAHVLSAVELLRDGTIGIVAVSREDLMRCGATEEDCEGLIDHIRDIETVEAACTLRDSIDGSIRVSLRAKRDFDVSAVAVSFGGGGHRRAAGCTLNMPLEDAVQTMKQALLEAVR